MPRPRRARVAVLLALLLVATVLPAGAQAAPPPEAPPSLPVPGAEPSPEVEPAVDAEPTPVVDLPAAMDPTAEPSPAAAPGPTDVEAAAAGDRVIVMLKDGTTVSKALGRLERAAAFRADRAFRHAFKGFAARLSKAQRKQLAADPAVLAIVPDERIELAAQSLPTGVSRVYGHQSPLADIDGVDERVDADVAIVDTGIALHPDLNVVGGYDCSTSDPGAWRDRQSHGTHVAGIVGALDNGTGVVGVAPGVRLWAVKILNDDGFGFISWYVCGLDWILAQRDPNDSSRPLIEAVNMSVGKSGQDDHDCGNTIPSAMHQAVCRVVAGGIPIAVAAMNASTFASNYEPAAYNEVMTVSALADTDGAPGGNGGSACYSWGGYDSDDTFANFSNFGADVDLIAPGKCIRSTVPGGYGLMSGTSMATPLVTGATALYRSTHPDATPSQVRTVLRALGSQSWKTGTDPDNEHEPLLDVRRIAGRGDFGISLPGGTLALNESGGPIPITISRTAEAFEPVVFSVSGLPSGATATITPSVSGGFDAKSATMRVNLPSTVPGGTWHLTVTGTIQGRTRSDSVTVTFTDQAPSMGAVTTRLGGEPRPTSSTTPMRVRWPAASDPSGVIASFRVEQSTDGGAWSTITTVGGQTREIYRTLAYGHSYRFRVSATDGRGLTSGPTMTTSVTPTLVSQSAASYSGSWYTHTSSHAIGGSTRRSKNAGAWAVLSFTGRQIAWIGPMGKNRSRVRVYIDGDYVATVDQRQSSFDSRRVLLTHIFSTSGRHSIRLVNESTPKRPVAEVDAFVVVP
ncbi:MAG TPA: S8 family serine peptidase [Candidatus Limnocylindrales bacterium]